MIRDDQGAFVVEDHGVSGDLTRNNARISVRSIDLAGQVPIPGDFMRCATIRG